MGLGGISMKAAWQACEKLSDLVGGLRTHVNTGIAKATSGIGAQANHILGTYYGADIPVEKIPRKEVEVLIDKTVAGATWAKGTTLALGALSFLVSQYTPIFSPLFRVGSVISVLAFHEFKQIQDVAWEAKKVVKHYIPDEVIVWNSRDEHATNKLAPVIERCSVLLQSRLLFFNRSILFGQEIRLLTSFVSRKIDAAMDHEEHLQLKWVPDRTEGQDQVRNYLGKLKAEATELIEDFQDEDFVGASAARVQALVQEAMRPIAFARASAITSAIVLYTASVYLPFSMLSLIGSIVSAALGFEMHQLHSSVQSELSEPLLAKGGSNITWDDSMKLVKNTCLKVRETTWLFHRDYFFGREISKIPEYLQQLYVAKGKFEDESVTWIDKSTITAVLETVKNWHIYLPKWAGE